MFKIANTNGLGACLAKFRGLSSTPSTEEGKKKVISPLKDTLGM
jgi:hypothetical protein